MNVNVSVPDELYQKAFEIAEAQHVSVDEVFASAFVEQLAAWERLKERPAAAVTGFSRHWIKCLTWNPRSTSGSESVVRSSRHRPGVVRIVTLPSAI